MKFSRSEMTLRFLKNPPCSRTLKEKVVFFRCVIIKYISLEYCERNTDTSDKKNTSKNDVNYLHLS